MSKLGSKARPVIIKVQTEDRAAELLDLCTEKGWQVIIGLEPDEEENIDDLLKLDAGIKPFFSFKASPSKNAPCPCGSGKQYKRCCGK